MEWKVIPDTGDTVQVFDKINNKLHKFDSKTQAAKWFGYEEHYFMDVQNKFNNENSKFKIQKLKDDERMTIYVNAPIGSGKTSLSYLLGDLLDIDVYTEKVDGNELLELFYQDRARYSFLFQVHVMNQRFADIKKARLVKHSIADSDLYSDCNFVKLMEQRGEISKVEANEYYKLHANMLEELSYIPTKVPELMIFINIPHDLELERIAKRGRDFEDFNKIPELKEYFAQHHKIATDFQDSYDKSAKLIIDGAKYDFVENEEDSKEVLMQCVDKLFDIGTLTTTEALEAYKKIHNISDSKDAVMRFYNHANTNGVNVPYHVIAWFYDIERLN